MQHYFFKICKNVLDYSFNKDKKQDKFRRKFQKNKTWNMERLTRDS